MKGRVSRPLKGGGHIMTTFVMVYLKGRGHGLYTPRKRISTWAHMPFKELMKT